MNKSLKSRVVPVWIDNKDDRPMLHPTQPPRSSMFTCHLPWNADLVLVTNIHLQDDGTIA
jgi:hypothetical protein